MLQEMINNYQSSLVCIVETHMQKEEEPKYQAIVLCTVMTDQQMVEEY